MTRSRNAYGGYHVRYDPVGFACNMGWLVLSPTGQEIHRGPEWTCRLRLLKVRPGALALTDSQSSERGK